MGQVFLAMKIVKNRLRTKMYDDFLTDVLILFYKIVEKFTTNLIIDEFRDLKEHRVPLWQ